MCLDGPFGELQLQADLGVGPTTRDKQRYLRLAIAQRLQLTFTRGADRWLLLRERLSYDLFLRQRATRGLRELRCSSADLFPRKRQPGPQAARVANLRTSSVRLTQR
jgi:hypothetical protein